MTTKEVVYGDRAGFTDEGVAKRYQQYVEDHYGDVTDLPRLCEVMANYGGRRAITAMTTMSDILPLINRIEGRIVQLRAMIESLQDDVR